MSHTEVFSQISLVPIGIVRNLVSSPQDDIWGEVISSIELDSARFSSNSLAGLPDFSHVEVVFFFHQVLDEQVHTGARHPRGRADWPKVGIFAQRGKDRPNRFGVTVCQLLAVKGLTVEVQGLDAVDRTPVLDIKPYMAGFAPRGKVREPAWATELMSEYWSARK